MVQINLLPVPEKKQPKIKIGFNVDLGPIIFIWVMAMIVIIGVWVALGMQLAAKQKQFSQLNTELKSLALTIEKVGKLTKDKEELSQKLDFMRTSIARDTFWAKNLNRLSNLIPESIWLKGLVLYSKTEEDIKKYDHLDIQGTVVSLRGEEVIDIIGSFMKAIQNDQVFTEQFAEVKLVSSQRSQSGNIEIMDFQLFCQFR